MTTNTTPALEALSKSLADMIIEYVEGGIHSGGNWQTGLDHIIAARIRRLQSAALQPVSGEADPIRYFADQPIETAKTDGTKYVVWAAEAHGLPAFVTIAAYHPDAGWCVDELRPVTHWLYELPRPQSGEACGSSVRDKTVCASENAESETQPAPDEKPVAWTTKLELDWLEKEDTGRMMWRDLDFVKKYRIFEKNYPVALYISPQPQSDVVKALEDEVEALRAMLKRAIQPCYDEGKHLAGYNYTLRQCPFSNAEVEAIKADKPVAGLLKALRTAGGEHE